MVDRNGINPLYCAAIGGHLETARALLQQGADPNGGSDSALCPLVGAARNGDVPMVKLLLDYHADPNRPEDIWDGNSTSYPLSPLFATASAGLWKAHGSSPEPITMQQLLDIPLKKRSSDTAIAQLLLDHGAKDAFVDDYFHTPLAYAVADGNINLVRLLAAHDFADRYQVTPANPTLLDYARRRGYTDIVAFLAKRPGLYTPCYRATRLANGDIDVSLLTPAVRTSAL